MNCGIIIFEKEDHIYKLLKFRLSTYFPDAYIIRGTIGGTETNEIPLAESIHVLYDSDDYSYDQILEESETIDNVISISTVFNEDYKSGKIIDCKYLANKILNQSDSLIREKVSSSDSPDGSFYGRSILLISYAYIDERESLINTEFDYLKKCSHMCLRLDLMSGIRMPQSFSGIENTTGSLTELLDLARSNKLESKDIMAYSTPDSNGFVTPGKPRHSYDVFDYGINTLSNLIEAASDLTTDDTFPVNVFIVAEGFRISEFSQMAGLVDEVHFLLPERLYKNDPGFRSEIGTITRSLPSTTNVTMHYTDMFVKRKLYEASKI